MLPRLFDMFNHHPTLSSHIISFEVNDKIYDKPSSWPLPCVARLQFQFYGERGLSVSDNTCWVIYMKECTFVVRAQKINYPWVNCLLSLGRKNLGVCSLGKGQLVSFVRPSVIDVLVVMTAKKRPVGSERLVLLKMLTFLIGGRFIALNLRRKRFRC